MSLKIYSISLLRVVKLSILLMLFNVSPIKSQSSQILEFNEKMYKAEQLSYKNIDSIFFYTSRLKSDVYPIPLKQELIFLKLKLIFY